MKKRISLILTGLLIAISINAQNPETLTNSSVIKMSKANLSDELIIDMIQHSPVRFDLSAGATRNLENEGVSAAVIQSMENTANNNKVTESSTAATAQQKIPAPVKADTETNDPSPYEPTVITESVTVEALNYVGPLTELIKFNENKFKSLEIAISEWDKQVRGYIADISKVKDQMLQVENELRIKKNADTKRFNDDIMTLKGKLGAYRKNYRQSKDIMIKGGENIVKQIETMSSDVTKDLGKAYSEAGQRVGQSDTDPATGEKSVIMNYTSSEGYEKGVSYIVYLTEMLAWHQNEMRNLTDMINDWNPRVISLLQEDKQLKDQMEPIEKRIQELSSNAKQNKAEIATLKKQISAIEKSRKQLEDRMKDDAKDLAASIKQLSQVNQESAKERFTDIIENITYSFGEKLSL